MEMMGRVGRGSEKIRVVSGLQTLKSASESGVVLLFIGSRNSGRTNLLSMILLYRLQGIDLSVGFL